MATPSITQTHIYALSRVLPYTQASAGEKRSDTSATVDQSLPESEKSIIKRKSVLDGLATLIARNPNDTVTVAASRKPNQLTIYYAKTTPFTDDDSTALESLKTVLLDKSEKTVGQHSGRIINTVSELCLPAIVSRCEKLLPFAQELGISSDSQDDKFTIIIVPDEATVWEYITTLFGTNRLQNSNLKHVIRGLILNGPKKGKRKDTLETYLYMAGIMSRLLVNGLSIWRTGEKYTSPSGTPCAAGECGIFLAKTVFKADDPAGVYFESEELMGRFTDVILQVGAYSEASLELAAYTLRDRHFKKCLKEDRVIFEEIKLPKPSKFQVSEKPVDSINALLSKVKAAAITEEQVLRYYPEAGGRLKVPKSQSVECHVHCELSLLLDIIRREHTGKPAVKSLNVRYGCSRESCYLCEAYISVFRNKVVGGELRKFLQPEISDMEIPAEIKMEPKIEKPETTREDDLANMFSQLKGITTQHGKTLRSWFSQIGQVEKETSPLKIAAPVLPIEPEVRLTTPKEQPVESIVEEEEDFARSPGYTRGYRQICADWKFPKRTPKVVRDEIEGKIRARIEHIYTTCRLLPPPRESVSVHFAAAIDTISISDGCQ
ncbi:hypothetical protein H072_10738 [Dactylellina haptotyla CBS 200.50]|uniref:Uncharacterized protein n=1 Tax=Dactylellina haptotyla (strain CBS 200.50) TaxID=1284197 RepID=S8BKJ0_DACHA|nr:hypothetical protein H072_10738 [Dactylellina haptotyla CBS 200.50]